MSKFIRPRATRELEVEAYVQKTTQERDRIRSMRLFAEEDYRGVSERVDNAVAHAETLRKRKAVLEWTVAELLATELDYCAVIDSEQDKLAEVKRERSDAQAKRDIERAEKELGIGSPCGPDAKRAKK